ncbi:hypothetical protein AXE80_10795 [Wenyingzhuangia fucanilytica]|uniref:Uncharacterized protein n=1 Tax=Wenyingzhuangia fucanilytica TaxID=1790137 RepID=A0A1B1Y7H2_9FLAO|nr:hypothetical protein [Wenyingzhuangia fucanilytica]ANW96731.1 hypothetical protein AXE80_10795 [Wenyingzhuangia fucanilytica]
MSLKKLLFEQKEGIVEKKVRKNQVWDDDLNDILNNYNTSLVEILSKLTGQTFTEDEKEIDLSTLPTTAKNFLGSIIELKLYLDDKIYILTSAIENLNTGETAKYFDTRADATAYWTLLDGAGNTPAETFKFQIGDTEYHRFDASVTPERTTKVGDVIQLTDDANDVDQDKGAKVSIVKENRSRIELINDATTITTGKNLLDSRPSNMIDGYRIKVALTGYDPIGAATLIATKPIRLEYGETYFISGDGLAHETPRALFLESPVVTNGIVSGSAVSANMTEITGGYTFTANDADRLWYSVDVNTVSNGSNIIDGVIQLEKTAITGYEAYYNVLSTDTKSNKEIVSELDSVSEKIVTGKNLFDSRETNMKTGFRVNAASTQFDPNSGTNLVAVKPIKLEYGKTYTISGNGLAWGASPRSFMASSESATTGTTTVFTPVTNGFRFQVTDEDEVFFTIDLNTTTTGGNDVSGVVMLEDGSEVTEYEDYYLKFSTDEELGVDAVAVNKIHNIVPVIQDTHKKFPLFFNHNLKRDKNINVVLLGDSITARDYHTTYFSEEEQTKRPPLMVSKNIGSAIFDKLTWQNVEYSRWDRSSEFTESAATFVTVESNNLPSQGISQGNGSGGDEWYDIGDRPSDTRIYTGTALASVEFTIPEDFYTFNWIYRTDLKGCENVTVTVDEGNGKVEVFNGSTWVEANGYVMSMRHPGAVANRINTKFQERLRFRTCDVYDGGSFDERTGSKTITLTKNSSDSRFLYWGIEKSKEPYIVTVINSARGGENIASMLPAMNDDFYDWTETPNSFTFLIHEIYFNQGQNVYNDSKSINDFLNEWDDYFYSESNSYSFREKSKVSTIPWQKYEALQWNPNFTVGGGGISTTEPYGFKTWDNATDHQKTILDNFMCYLYQYTDTYSDEVGVAMVNTTKALLNEAKAKFGDEWYKAFQSTGVKGESFLNDITHPNDYGVKVISSFINAWFENSFI